MKSEKLQTGKWVSAVQRESYFSFPSPSSDPEKNDLHTNIYFILIILLSFVWLCGETRSPAEESAYGGVGWWFHE